MRTEGTQLDIGGLLPDFNSLDGYPETAEQLSALFIAALIGVAALFLVVLLVALCTAYIRTKWIQELLKDETSKSVVMSRQGLRDKASKVKPSLGHLWKEFDETLIEAKVGEEIRFDLAFLSVRNYDARALSVEYRDGSAPVFHVTVHVGQFWTQ